MSQVALRGDRPWPDGVRLRSAVRALQRDFGRWSWRIRLTGALRVTACRRDGGHGPAEYIEMDNPRQVRKELETRHQMPSAVRLAIIISHVVHQELGPGRKQEHAGTGSSRYRG